MKRVLAAVSALVGVGLILAAADVLADSNRLSAAAAVNDTRGGPAVQVSGVSMVVNKDGSAALGARLRNRTDVEVALMGVAVSVESRRLPVNDTPMWLPVPSGGEARVGAASDAGGFLVPDGISDATRADVEFRFDDGTCVLAEVTAAARTDEHHEVFPKSGKPIGPVTTDAPPPGTTACQR